MHLGAVGCGGWRRRRQLGSGVLPGHLIRFLFHSGPLGPGDPTISRERVTLERRPQEGDDDTDDDAAEHRLAERPVEAVHLVQEVAGEHTGDEACHRTDQQGEAPRGGGGDLARDRDVRGPIEVDPEHAVVRQHTDTVAQGGVCGADALELGVEIGEVVAHLLLEAFELRLPGGRQRGAGVLGADFSTQQLVEPGVEGADLGAEALQPTLVTGHVADHGLHLLDVGHSLAQLGLEIGDPSFVLRTLLVCRGDPSALAHEVFVRDGLCHDSLLSPQGKNCYSETISG